MSLSSPKITKRWLPQNYAKVLTDHAFDAEGPLGTFSVGNLNALPELVQNALTNLSNYFSKHVFIISQITISLVDEDLHFSDSNAIFLPLGEGTVSVGVNSEAGIEYRDKIVIEDPPNGVTFKAPNRAYYLYGFHPAAPIERFDHDVLTNIRNYIPYEDMANFMSASRQFGRANKKPNEDVDRRINKYRLKGKNWDTWLKDGGSSDPECYKYILDNMDIYKSLEISDEDRDEDRYDLMGSEKAFFIYKSLILAVGKSYLDVIDKLLAYTPIDYTSMLEAVDLSQYYDEARSLPANYNDMFEYISYEAASLEKYDVLNHLIRNPPKTFQGYSQPSILLTTTLPIVKYLYGNELVNFPGGGPGRDDEVFFLIADVIEYGDVDILDYLLRDILMVPTTDLGNNSNLTYLMSAVSSKNLDMLKYVISNTSKEFMYSKVYHEILNEGTIDMFEYMNTVSPVNILDRKRFFSVAVTKERYDIADYILFTKSTKDIINMLSSLTYYNDLHDAALRSATSGVSRRREGISNVDGVRVAKYLTESKYWKALSKDQKRTSIQKALGKLHAVEINYNRPAKIEESKSTRDRPYPGMAEYLQELKRVHNV